MKSSAGILYLEVMKMNQLLKIEHISKYYGEASNVTKALDDVSFTVEAGEFVGIMGGQAVPERRHFFSASRHWMNRPSEKIHLRDREITELTDQEISRFRSESLGFVFQEYNLLDTLTLGENIELALTIRRVPGAEIPSACNRDCRKARHSA